MILLSYRPNEDNTQNFRLLNKTQTEFFLYKTYVFPHTNTDTIFMSYLHVLAYWELHVAGNFILQNVWSAL